MRGFLAILLFWWGAAGSAVADVFDPITNLLSIPNLQIGATNYQNATLLLSPTGQWSVLSLGTVGAASSTSTGTSSSTTALPLQINPAKPTAYVGGDLTVVASGGTPPYRFYSSSSNLVQTYQSGNSASFAVYGIGETTIVVADSAGNQATSTPTLTSKLDVGPATQSAVVGEQVTVTFSNGVPPYTVGTSNSITAKAGEVTMHSGTLGSATIYTFRPGTVAIMVHDAFGNMKSATLTVTATR